MLLMKGIVIGIGKIIPGVSGSMLAISMGIYKNMIDSVNNFFDDIKSNFIYLFKIGIGVLLSIVFLSKVILVCLSKHYIATIFLFIGLIIGSFDGINNKIKFKNKKLIIITLIVSLLFGMISIKTNLNIQNNIIKFLYFIVVGIVDAFTMVIPGISGTATLMMIGAYDILMETFSNLLNLENFISNFLIMLPFSIGMVIGIFSSVKLINYLFNHFEDNTYSIIIGFGISTILLMAIKCFFSTYTLLGLIFSFVMLFLGIFISKKINHIMICD